MVGKAGGLDWHGSVSGLPRGGARLVAEALDLPQDPVHRELAGAAAALLLLLIAELHMGGGPGDTGLHRIRRGKQSIQANVAFSLLLRKA